MKCWLPWKHRVNCRWGYPTRCCFHTNQIRNTATPWHEELLNWMPSIEFSQWTAIVKCVNKIHVDSFPVQVSWQTSQKCTSRTPYLFLWIALTIAFTIASLVSDCSQETMTPFASMTVWEEGKQLSDNHAHRIIWLSFWRVCLLLLCLTCTITPHTVKQWSCNDNVSTKQRRYQLRWYCRSLSFVSNT